MRRFSETLYLQVLVAVAIGILIGLFEPRLGLQLQPLANGFVKLIKMVFAPVILLTVVLGIARMENLADLGRIGVKSLVYFEVVSTLALLIGLGVVALVKPGVGMNVDPHTLDAKALSSYTSAAPDSIGDFLLHMIPDSAVDALAKNDVLPILFFGILFGIALARLGSHAAPLVNVLDITMKAMFQIVAIIMRFAPIAALGAMSFTVSKYGFASILSLGKLMLTMYITCILFIFVVLGAIARLSGFSLWRFLRYLKDEIVTVLGTSSSESVLPQLMLKLERIGCARSTVGLVVPAGIVFNPDGQCIYYTMASIFIAQATNTHLTAVDVLVLFGVLMVSSKGSAGVTGSAFITLAATLTSLGKIPVAGMVLILGIDRFMSEARALTNTIGTAVGTMAVGRWSGTLDLYKVNQILHDQPTVATFDK
ncbi:C4-dicarboxylate transporter DctA [Edaphobacter modestus]|uniref:Aerobic C4-dicarboxylate transport protein n=1 Tax=Edaphobacter modestus TaxID=388466 RepID=A0A4Q7Z1C9_9BACT|nr:C4-dicarboxylate transporter DctA [Edaphobacter modestus]RZU43441.1 aerobic C4-dicarboxylate transport protein [Edaphobacter modestus]